jgi:hypothetical protein
MGDNWEELPNLWRWTCPHCLITIRTRAARITADRARQHLWEAHRAPTTLVVPVACMWDVRIKGHVALTTHDDDLA